MHPCALAIEPRGIYVYSTNVSNNGGPNQVPELTASLHVPGVDGVTLLEYWKNLEPDMGVYSFNRFDLWIDSTRAAGKKVCLALAAGDASPCWLVSGDRCGASYGKPTAGIEPLDFLVSDRAGLTGSACNPVTVAAPWDSTYQARWDTLLAHVAGHLQDTGRYGTVTSIRLTGINRTTAELRLPEETHPAASTRCLSLTRIGHC